MVVGTARLAILCIVAVGGCRPCSDPPAARGWPHPPPPWQVTGKLDRGAPRRLTDLGCTLDHPIAVVGLLVGRCWPFGPRGFHGLVAVDPQTGARRWRLEIAMSAMVQPAHDADTAYFAFNGLGLGHVLAVDVASGRERWRTMIPDDVSHAAVVGEVVVALGHHIHGLAADTGEPLWQAERLDDDPPSPEGRSLLVHRGLIIRPRPGAVDGLDPTSGDVAMTRALPTSGGAQPFAALPVLGDPLVPQPPVDVDAAPDRSRRRECAWDRSIAPARPAHLGVGLPRGAYVRHRDHVFFASGQVLGIPLIGGHLRWLGIDEAPDRIAVDDDFVYWAECNRAAGCAGDRRDWSLVRVARFDARRFALARGLEPVNQLAAAAGHLYWSSASGLHRMPRDGGRIDTVWRGARVTQMVVADDVLLFTAGAVLRAMPLDGGAPAVLARTIEETLPPTFDATHVYAATRPGATGSIVIKVPRRGGRVRRVAAFDRAPQAMAAGEDRLFVAIRNGEILSVGVDGGEVSLVAGEEATSPCGETWRLEVAGDSLLWIGADRPGDAYGNLWRFKPPSR